MGWETGNYSRMLRHISNINRTELAVGIVQSKKHPDPRTGKSIDMAYLLQIHEEGRGNNPKRATLVPSVAKASHVVSAKLISQGAVTGLYHRELITIGQRLQTNAKSHMMALKNPPIKRATSRTRINKNSTNPLVDTGMLIRSIGFKVV